MTVNQYASMLDDKPMFILFRGDLNMLFDNQYLPVPSLGSFTQTPIAFLFDGANRRPTEEEVVEYASRESDTNPLPDIEDVDFGDGYGITYADPNDNLEGSTNDSVMVNGSNVLTYKPLKMWVLTLRCLKKRL